MTAPRERRESAVNLAVVIGAGIGVRLLWLASAHGLTQFVEAGEATRVALSLAAGRGFSDAFFAGQGPTAHLLPIAPGIAGAVFALFGPSSALANLTLLVVALAETFGAYLLLRMLFEKCRADPAVLRWSMIVLCLAPIYMPQETLEFRYWEGALALALVAASLLMMLSFDEMPQIGTRHLLAAAGLSAVTFFVSPPAGIALDLCWMVVAFRRLVPRDIVRFAVFSGLALGLLIAPWALRNQVTLGTPVLLRSNFGLELAIGTDPTALTTLDPGATFERRVDAIHPYRSHRAAEALRQSGGEVAYARGLGDHTERWILDHPTLFAALCIAHVRGFFFPAAWQMTFSGWPRYQQARATILSTIDFLGLIGLLIGLFQRRRGYGLIALYVVTVSLPYALVQPIPRYTYLVYGLLVFLAVQFVVDVARYGMRRSSPPGARWLR